MKTLLVLFFAFSSAHANTSLEQNKKIVLEFFDMAFNQRKPREAAMKYLDENYIQHNPYVATGRQPFIDFFESLKDDGTRTSFKRTIAEGDLVMVHCHHSKSKNDPGRAGMDIFRLKDGKIMEHWDVNQQVPAQSKNKNTMF